MNLTQLIEALRIFPDLAQVRAVRDSVYITLGSDILGVVNLVTGALDVSERGREVICGNGQAD